MPNRILDGVATWLTVACALTVTGLLVRRELAPAQPVGQPPAQVADWRTYHAVGSSRGPVNAPVAMTIFTDFQCPACALLEQRMKVLDSARPGVVNVVYRNWPLTIHPKARVAAFAAECAGRQGKYWPAHTALFAARDSVGVQSWGTFASSLDIADTARFTQCVRDSSEVATIQRDEAAAKRLGGRGTPLILVGPFLFDGVPTTDTLLAYVDRERRSAR